jgi:hypothetical protein
VPVLDETQVVKEDQRAMATALHDLSIAELSRLIEARTLSPVEVLEALIRRIEQYDDQVHAFITRTLDLARQQAREAEAEIAARTAPAGDRRGAANPSSGAGRAPDLRAEDRRKCS